MKRVLIVGAILAFLKLGIFVLEQKLLLLSKIAEALDVVIPTGLMAQSPLLAVALIGILFVMIGIFFADRTLILVPILLCAAEVSALVPLLGIQQIAAFASFSNVAFLASVLAVVGAFILKDSNSVWRIREGRIGVIWKLIVAIEAINLGLYAYFSYPVLTGAPIMLLSALICGGIFIWISNAADAAAMRAVSAQEDASTVPGLHTKIAALTSERDKALKEVGEWRDACIIARRERDAARGERDTANGALTERDANVKRLEGLLKAFGQDLAKPVEIPKAA
jgi:hypothetical protein